jgi:hypothetical protein
MLTFRKRIAVLGLLLVLFLAVYGVGRHYSAVIVTFVVEQTLIQKAPRAENPLMIRGRFEQLMQSVPADRKLKKLLALSSYLEKIQKLTSAEFERLLQRDEMAPKAGF